MPERPLIIAHRGAAAEAAENTLEAFRLAIEIGAGAIELDVHLSADGVPVVIHDATLDRTTEASGRVDARSAGELAGLGVPALSDVTDLLAAQDRTGLVMELKWNDENACSRDDLAKAALAALAGFGGSLLLQSFDGELLAACHRAAPGAPLGLLTDRADAEAPAGVPLAAWNPHGKLVARAPGIIARKQAEGLRVYVWTVNEPEHIRQLASAGADGIITDDPRGAGEVLSGA